MNKQYQRYFNIFIAMLIAGGILIMPLNVKAARMVIRPEVLTDEPEELGENEREVIRSEREETRAEGVKSGEKLEVTLGETTVESLFAEGPLAEAEIAEVIGRMSQKDYQQSGILASVTAAQCILETGFLGTSLARDANNCFGMKATLSGNTWGQSTWAGDIYNKQTWEEYNGKAVTIMADFRRYASMEQSLGDHSAYLLNAKNGAGLRYAGIQGETDYRRAIQIIKDGGYATDSRYVDKICSIIERFDLTRYDVLDASYIDANKVPLELFRVRKSWEDVDSQLGAFVDLENAKRKCQAGYKVFNPEGEVVYEK